eukprot:PhF_6_TR12701/c0_g1_i1/m.20162
MMGLPPLEELDDPNVVLGVINLNSSPNHVMAILDHVNTELGANSNVFKLIIAVLRRHKEDTYIAIKDDVKARWGYTDSLETTNITASATLPSCDSTTNPQRITQDEDSVRYTTAIPNKTMTRAITTVTYIFQERPPMESPIGDDFLMPSPIGVSSTTEETAKVELGLKPVTRAAVPNNFVPFDEVQVGL